MQKKSRGISAIWKFWGLFLSATLILSSQASAAPQKVLLLHTNDLHSHFRPDSGPLGLGGVARIKSLVREIRKAYPATLLVDGGDFSEGHIYFNLDGAEQTLRVMNEIGYDAAVVGNHDWLNGPDHLIEATSRAGTGMRLLAANIRSESYSRSNEFKKVVTPYSIHNVGTARIALIGVVTYEFIYDRWFKPIRIVTPFSLVRDLAAQLKARNLADVVVAVSHNGEKLNRQLLEQAASLDFVIGAHDHRKYNQPLMVQRKNGPDGFIVEVGNWGQFMGAIQLEVNPQAPAGSPKWKLDQFSVIQIDSGIPSDPELEAGIERLEARLEARYQAPIFSNRVGESKIHVRRSGPQSWMGSLSTDAYRALTGADFAVDQTSFISGEFHKGPIRSADVFNASPGFFDVSQGRSWTVKKVPILGKTLRWLLNFFYSSEAATSDGLVSASGLRMTYSPAFLSDPSQLEFLPGLNHTGPSGMGESLNDYLVLRPADSIQKVVREVLIQGRPLDESKTYQMAVGGGIFLTFEFINGIFPGAIPLDRSEDTGIETWRALESYVTSQSPIQERTVDSRGRVRTHEPDLALFSEKILVTPQGLDSHGRIQARVKATVYNFGATPSRGGEKISVVGRTNGTSQTVDPVWKNLAPPQALPVLQPEQSTEITWESVLIPGDAARSLWPVAVWVERTTNERLLSNNGRETWVTSAQ